MQQQHNLPAAAHAALAGRLREAGEHALYWVALLCFGGVCLVLSLVATLLHPLLRRRGARRFGRAALSTFFRTYLNVLQATGALRLDLTALDALRDEPGVIIAPNHPSLLDAVLILSRVPQAGCIMKRAIADNWVLGGAARLGGYIANDEAHGMVRRAVRDLRAGEALLVFPEGTRTVREPVNAFRGGFALIARHARAPVQSVFIETNSPFLAKGWPLLRKPALPLEYRVRLGRRFEVSAGVRACVRQLEAYYTQELRAFEAPSPHADGAIETPRRERRHA
jgi:1-acyl-sn-glycerol-3-phosphate acyltransferase